MNDGIVEQFDTPGNLYHNPKNLFVAAFIGSPQMNFYDASLINDGNNFSVNLWDKVLNLPESIKNRLNLKNSHQDIVLGIRSENIYYADSKGESTINVIAKKVEQLGSDTYVYFDTPASKNESVARFNPPRNVSINEEIGLNFDLEKIIIFDKETGLNILKTEDISYF